MDDEDREQDRATEQDTTEDTSSESQDTQGSPDADERVKDRGHHDEDTTGVTDARPGREDIGEGSMPSDYHQAVAERPVEVTLPETPDLSEDAEDPADSED